MNYNDWTLDELKRLVAADEADEMEVERKSMEKKKSRKKKKLLKEQHFYTGKGC